MEELFIIADGEAVAAAQSTAAQTTTVQTVSQDGASATQANQQAAPAGGLMSMLPLILIFSRLWGIDGVKMPLLSSHIVPDGNRRKTGKSTVIP